MHQSDGDRGAKCHAGRPEQEGARHMFIRSHFAGPALLAAAFALALAGCARSQASGKPAVPPAPEVTVADVIAKPLRDWEEFTGRLQAVDSVEIRPRVSGFIDSVQFAEGT